MEKSAWSTKLHNKSQYNSINSNFSLARTVNTTTTANLTKRENKKLHTISQIAFLFGLLFEFFFSSLVHAFYSGGCCSVHFPIVILVYTLFSTSFCMSAEQTMLLIFISNIGEEMNGVLPFVTPHLPLPLRSLSI